MLDKDTLLAHNEKTEYAIVTEIADELTAHCPIAGTALKMKLGEFNNKGAALQVNVINGFLRDLLYAYSGRTQNSVIYPLKAIVSDRKYEDWKRLLRVGVYPFFKEYNVMNVKEVK